VPSFSNSLTPIPSGVDATRKPSNNGSLRPSGPTETRSNSLVKPAIPSGVTEAEACGDNKLEQGEDCDPSTISDANDAKCCTDSCGFASGGSRCGPAAGACFNKRRCSAKGLCKESALKAVGATCALSGGADGVCDRVGRCVEKA